MQQLTEHLNESNREKEGLLSGVQTLQEQEQQLKAEYDKLAEVESERRSEVTHLHGTSAEALIHPSSRLFSCKKKWENCQTNLKPVALRSKNCWRESARFRSR